MLLFLFGAFQVALVVKNLPANAGDVKGASLIPGFGRTPGGGHMYRCLITPPPTHMSIYSWTKLEHLTQNINSR